MRAEAIYESAATTVLRVNGRAREGAEGRHRRCVIYVSATVTPHELMGLLLDVVDGLQKATP